jgi:uracil-DNA glycosylase
MPQSRKTSQVSASGWLPERRTLATLREAASDCRGCPLYERARQTVFGAGSAHARVIFVGEQPGDREDVEGKPFVGPAGLLLDRCLVEAGFERDEVYITNAVKHFKWVPRGKRRIHEKPGLREIAACRPWLDAEIEVVKPALLVCLGATAAQALIGSSFRVTKSRGKVLAPPAPQLPPILATVHPSAILRAPDDEARAEARGALVRDLSAAAAWLRKHK